MSRSPDIVRLFTFCAIFTACATFLVHAQDTATQSPGRPVVRPLVDLGDAVTFEICPHTGLMGSSGTFGLNMLMTYSSLSLELGGEQVIGKTANLYPISLNIMVNLATRGRLIPYGTVGAGLWLTVPTTALGAQTISTPGLNFGGGARYFFTKSVGVRLEGKQYITSVSSKRELKEELLFFQEVSLGFVVLLR